MVPIHYAVLKSNYEMVKFLIENKVDELIVGEYKMLKQQNGVAGPGRNPKEVNDRKLFAENRTKELEKIKKQKRAKIKMNQTNLVNVPQIDNFTPVHYACHRGSLSIL